VLELSGMTQRQRLGISSSKLGFSLVELIVAIAIGVTLIISLSSALITQQRDEKELRQAFEVNEIETEVMKILSDPSTCLATLGTVPPASVTLSGGLVAADGTVLLMPPRTYANLITLTGMSIAPLLAPATAAGRWQFQITLTFAPFTGNTLIRDRQVEIFAETDEMGVIRSCGGSAPSDYSCRTTSRSSPGRSVTVTCDTLGTDYRVVSCGMADDVPDKNSWRRTQSRPPGTPNGCYCYDNNSSGSIACIALCCRY
jgi:hypothetical protein